MGNMGKSCKDIAQTLVDCLKKSECVKKGGDLKFCMKSSDSNDECKEFRMAYFSCRRGGLDMRNRIRGERVY